jgi:hypothetical protein
VCARVLVKEPPAEETVQEEGWIYALSRLSRMTAMKAQ